MGAWLAQLRVKGASAARKQPLAASATWENADDGQVNAYLMLRLSKITRELRSIRQEMSELKSLFNSGSVSPAWTLCRRPTNTQTTYGSGIGDGGCYNCGETGHKKWNCPGGYHRGSENGGRAYGSTLRSSGEASGGYSRSEQYGMNGGQYGGRTRRGTYRPPLIPRHPVPAKTPRWTPHGPGVYTSGESDKSNERVDNCSSEEEALPPTAHEGSSNAGDTGLSETPSGGFGMGRQRKSKKPSEVSTLQLTTVEMGSSAMISESSLGNFHYDDGASSKPKAGGVSEERVVEIEGGEIESIGSLRHGDSKLNHRHSTANHALPL